MLELPEELIDDRLEVGEVRVCGQSLALAASPLCAFGQNDDLGSSGQYQPHDRGPVLEVPARFPTQRLFVFVLAGDLHGQRGCGTAGERDPVLPGQSPPARV